jgi:hypothetical protein
MSALFDAILTAIARAALMSNPLSPEPGDHSVGTDPNAPHDRTGSSGGDGAQPQPTRQAPTADPLIPTTVVHGYTCGKCPWGRDRARTHAEWVEHVDADHEGKP